MKEKTPFRAHNASRPGTQSKSKSPPSTERRVKFVAQENHRKKYENKQGLKEVNLNNQRGRQSSIPKKEKPEPKVVPGEG